MPPGRGDPGSTDRIEKLREYQATPSIRRYVILEQDSIAAMVSTRLDGGCDGRAAAAGDVLAMPEIDVTMPLVDIYADVTLPEVEAG